MTILLAAGAGSAFLVMGARPDNVQAEVSLRYKQAGDGLTPAGTRFDAYEILSSDVLEKAGKKINRTLDPSDFHLAPSYAGNGKTYATDYRIEYHGRDGERVLKAVLSEWKEEFTKEAFPDPVILEYTPPDSDADYLSIEGSLEDEAEEILRYANSRIKEDGTWMPKDGKKSFPDIAGEAENITNVTLADLRTYIVQNGISKDAKGFARTIAYRNRQLKKKKDQADAQYENRTQAIKDLYDSTLFPTVSIPSVNNNTYYITTTRTGLDDIYDDTAGFLKTSLDLQRTITDNEQTSSHLGAGSGSAGAASDMIAKAEQKIRQLAEDAKATDEEYRKKQADLVQVKVDGQEITGEDG